MSRLCLVLSVCVILGMMLNACRQGASPSPDAPQPGPTAPATREVPTPTSVPATPTAVAYPAPLPSPNTPAAIEAPTPARLTAGQPVTLTHISMFSATTGWALGGNTIGGRNLLRTVDGGLTWRDVTPSQAYLNPLTSGAVTFFLDAEHAWVAYDDRAVWRTDDGGQSWAPIKSASASPSLGLGFTDPQTGWFVEGGVATGHEYVTISTTKDGGQNWEAVASNLPEDPLYNVDLACYPRGFTFVDSETGWAVGECFGLAAGPFWVGKTSDGGQTWETQPAPPPPDRPTLFDSILNCTLYPLVHSSAANWKVGLSCSFDASTPPQTWLYTTADQGKTWSISTLPSGHTVSFEFISPAVGWWIGTDDLPANVGSRLYQTSDGGQTWTLTKRLGWTWTSQLNFVDEQIGWAVAWSCADEACSTRLTAVVKATDGGKTWQEIKPQIAP